MTGTDVLTPMGWADLVAKYPKTCLLLGAIQVVALVGGFVWVQVKPDPMAAQLQSERATSSSLSQELMKARADVADTHVENTRLQGRKTALEEENHTLSGHATEVVQEGDAHRAHITALEKRVTELEGMLGQARPVVLTRVNLRKDSETKVGYGLSLQYKGSSDDHIDIVFDGSKRLGIPRAAFTEAFPLRYAESVGAYLGVVPIVLLDKDRMLDVAIVKFPPAWNFAPNK